MTDAVIVATARTPIGKAGRGVVQRHARGHDGRARRRRGGAGARVSRRNLLEDSLWGCGYPEYVTGGNVARQIVLRAGLPASIAAATVNRFLRLRAAGRRHGRPRHRAGAAPGRVLVGGVREHLDGAAHAPAMPARPGWRSIARISTCR